MERSWKSWYAVWSALLLAFPAGLLSQPLQIDVWYGAQQRVGFLGNAQNDFNLLGHVSPADQIKSLSYTLNDQTPVALSFTAYRRLARNGDFNADIPIETLAMGGNTVTITAVALDNSQYSRQVTVMRGTGDQPVPVTIRWGMITDAQQAGQVVDGKWVQSASGLRVDQTGYDRLFLIGNRDWKDYDVTAEVTIHEVASPTVSNSGAQGLGLIMRFTGHVVGGPRNFPDAQPKWGYQPFGAIGWLRWNDGEDGDPDVCYYAGDSDIQECFGTVSAGVGTPLKMRMRAETLADNGNEGVTRYSFKVWNRNAGEPETWNWHVDQSSEDALRTGGVALVAHNVDATFGTITAVRTTPLAVVGPARLPAISPLAVPGAIRWSPRGNGGIAVVRPDGRVFDIRGRLVGGW